MNNQKTGKFIAELRKAKNLTQKALATQLFVSDRAVSKWERGLSFPDIGLIEKLARILEVSISEVLNGEKIDNINQEKSDEIIKESLPLFKKQYLKNLIATIIIIIALGLSIGYFGVLWYGELHYGEITYKNGASRAIPSFSGNVAKNNSKKFIKALVNGDYNLIDKMLVSNILISDKIFEQSFDKDNSRYYTEYYIDNLKSLKKAGVKITKYKFNVCHHNGHIYSCIFDLELEYEKTKYSMSMYLDNYQKQIVLSGIGYNYDFAALQHQNRELYDKIERIFKF